MEGVEREVGLFSELRRGSPVYALERTGGAAALLGETAPETVTVFDRVVLEGLPGRQSGRETGGVEQFVPYPHNCSTSCAGGGEPSSRSSIGHQFRPYTPLLREQPPVPRSSRVSQKRPSPVA